MAHRVVERQNVSMETQPSDGVVAVAVFYVAAHRMPHVGSMDTYLILPSRLKPELHKRVGGCSVEHMIVSDSVFAAVVYRRAVSDISLVVLQPVGYRTLVVLHLTAQHGHVAAVEDNVVPVVLKNLLGLYVLGVNHQPTRVAVEAVHNMSRALLPRTAEVVVEHRLDVQRAVAGGHTEDSDVLLYDHNIGVLIDEFEVLAVEGIVLLRLAHTHLVARMKRIVELSAELAVNLHAHILERCLHLRLTLTNIGQQPVKESGVALDSVMREIIPLIWISMSHIGGKGTKKKWKRAVFQIKVVPLQPIYIYSYLIEL